MPIRCARTFAVLAIVVVACQAPLRSSPQRRALPWTRSIEAALLRRHVEILASDAMAGRATPSREIDVAATYIESEFRAMGLGVQGGRGYRQTFACAKGAQQPSSNVVGFLRGGDPKKAGEAVIVSAHYDHLGVRSGDVLGDRIFNGANDNASGVAGMLSIAQALVDLPRPPARTVVFVAFCGEERGLRGSQYFVDHPLWPLASMFVHINLEMLGKPGRQEPLAAWVTGAERSNLLSILRDVRTPDPTVFVDESEVNGEGRSLFNRSDNFPFAQRGVVAHTIATGGPDPMYHDVGDRPEQLDYGRMAMIVRSIAASVYALAQTTQTIEWTGREPFDLR